MCLGYPYFRKLPNDPKGSMAGKWSPSIPKSYWKALHLRKKFGVNICKYAILGQSHMANHPNMIKHGLRRNIRNAGLEIVRIWPDHCSVFPWISKWIQEFPPQLFSRASHIENHPSQTWQNHPPGVPQIFFGWNHRLASRMKLPCCNFRSCSRCLRSSVDVFPRFSCEQKLHHWNTCDT